METRRTIFKGCRSSSTAICLQHLVNNHHTRYTTKFSSNICCSTRCAHSLPFGNHIHRFHPYFFKSTCVQLLCSASQPVGSWSSSCTRAQLHATLARPSAGCEICPERICMREEKRRRTANVRCESLEKPIESVPELNVQKGHCMPRSQAQSARGSKQYS